MSTVSKEIFDAVLTQIEATDPQLLDDAERIVMALESVANDARKLSGRALSQGERAIRAIVFSRDTRPIKAFYRLAQGVPCLDGVWRTVWSCLRKLFTQATLSPLGDKVVLCEQCSDLLGQAVYKALPSVGLVMPNFSDRPDEKSPYTYSMERPHAVVTFIGKGRLLSTLSNMRWTAPRKNSVLTKIRELQALAADWHKVDVSVRGVDKITPTQRQHYRDFEDAATILDMEPADLYAMFRKELPLIEE